MNTENPRDATRDEFRRLLVEAVVELDSELRAKQDKRVLGWHFNYPSMSVFPNGLPHFSKKFEGPTDYTQAFGRGQFCVVDDAQLDSSKALIALIEGDEYLRNYFEFPLKESTGVDPKQYEKHREYSSLSVRLLAQNLYDRYLHTVSSTPPTPEQLNPLATLVEHGVFEPRLHFDIVVPVLLTDFEEDVVDLGHGLSLTRMDEALQLGRSSRHGFGSGVHETVMGAATHALSMPGWYIANSTQGKASQVLRSLSAYSKARAIADRFFCAMRLVENVRTGYAQILGIPSGWAMHWKCDLLEVTGTSVREYPASFDNYSWLEERTHVSATSMSDVVSCFGQLSENEDNAVHVSAGRLNAAFLRSSQSDVVLDACIGLETLLGDPTPGELTHKLATRLAALARHSRHSRLLPERVFSSAKRLYRARSAIVHGRTQKEKGREIEIAEGKKLHAADVAVEFLRLALRAILEEPKYVSPNEIDVDLLLRASGPRE